LVPFGATLGAEVWFPDAGPSDEGDPDHHSCLLVQCGTSLGQKTSNWRQIVGENIATSGGVEAFVG